MPASITISGVPPYDGSYPLDLEEEFFTNKELREIKLLTGVRGGELMEAINAGDNDVIVAFALTAIRRAGQAIHPDMLWNATAGSITFDAGDEEEGEESLPPASALDEPPASPDGSGGTSDSPSEPSPVTPLRTGVQGSDTGAVSASGT